MQSDTTKVFKVDGSAVTQPLKPLESMNSCWNGTTWELCQSPSTGATDGTTQRVILASDASGPWAASSAQIVHIDDAQFALLANNLLTIEGLLLGVLLIMAMTAIRLQSMRARGDDA